MGKKSGVVAATPIDPALPGMSGRIAPTGTIQKTEQMVRSSRPARPLRRVFNRELLAYLGPGFIVTVGFIDPGNWATNMAGGADFNYNLLWVITLSTLMLILMQNMAARLGVITGRSLAENIHSHFSKPARAFYAATIFTACSATSLAEYLGGALGLNILFGIPIWLGALLTLAFVAGAVLGQRYRQLEQMIMIFLAFIAAAYVAEVAIARPDWRAAIPRMIIPTVDSHSILVAMGMLGAVVMSHNIYLHSTTIQSRDWSGSPARREKLLRFEFIDTVLAMGLGWVVNSSMILVAAGVFHRAGVTVTSIEQAAETLKPLAGDLASLIFAIALLLCGVGSSITASLAGGTIMAGYLGGKSEPRSFWFRAGVIGLTLPALGIIALNLDSYKLLIMSQVVLSIMLPFTLIPLLLLTNSRRVMGGYANGPLQKVLGLLSAVIIIGLNFLLLYRTFGGTFSFS